jgi:hypothetical protein
MDSGSLFKVCPKTGKRRGINFASPWFRYAFPIAGFIALAWYLLRVIPKPSRATYPCMQVAAPMASGFVGYILALAASVYGLRKAGQYMKTHRYWIASAFAILALCGLFVCESILVKDTLGQASGKNISNGKFTPTDKPNTPMGTPKGIFPGRVAWAHDPAASKWDGKSKFWWSPENINQPAIDNMLVAVLNNVAGADDIVKSWDILFKDFNQKNGKGNVGYKNTEKIAVKINLNNNSNSNKIDASPQLVHSLLDELVNKVGVPQKNITVYDAERAGIDAVKGYCSPDFADIHYQNRDAQNQVPWVADKLGFSSPEVTDTDVRRIPQFVVEADYLINMALLKRHSRPSENWKGGDGQTAVTLTGKNHFGTCGKPAALHETIRDWYRGMGKYNSIVDLMGSKELSGKTVIYILDGLVSGDLHNAAPKKWKMAPFNDDWPSSVFASQDPVAIDSVGLDFLYTEWPLTANADNYLHEAALADNPPSGTVYKPDGVKLSSLGVHEHWNNPAEKKYSRNLGTENGIELIQVK